MAHAQVCPKCNGWGTLPKEGWTTSVDTEVTCPVCGGCGYLIIPDDHPVYPYPCPPSSRYPYTITWEYTCSCNKMEE